MNCMARKLKDNQEHTAGLEPKQNKPKSDWILDLIGIAAVASIGYGCYLIYEPAAYLSVGTLLLGFVILAARGT